MKDRKYIINILDHVFGEVCCDYCNEVIHTHIDCPVCGKEYTETDMYHAYWEWGMCEDKVFIVDCCESAFRILDYADGNLVLELLNEKK